MSLEFFAKQIWPNLGSLCICAGSRNSALLRFINENYKKDKKTLYTFYDERSAAFFALGLAKSYKQKGQGVAVVTTSGTAVAELLPAFIEAHYSQTPLVAVTADRPRRFRGSGAPQCINQVHLLSEYVDLCLDISDSDSESAISKSTQDYLATLQKSSRVHVNLCFEDSSLVPLTKTLNSGDKNKKSINEKKPNLVCHSLDIEESFVRNLSKLHRPLVVLGPGAIPWDQSAQEKLFKFLIQFKSPVLIETQNYPWPKEVEQLRVVSGERVLKWLDYHAVVRLGGVPTSRLWRDLESTSHKNISVISLDSKPFSGLSNGRSLHFDVMDFENFWSQVSLLNNVSRSDWTDQELDEFKKQDLNCAFKVQKLLKKYPRSEPALVAALSEWSLSHLYLGNSMPIREWDLFGQKPHGTYCRTESHRGANGIDGQLSGCLGWLEGQENVGRALSLCGDLTTLYDLGAPWVLPQMKVQKNIVLAVVNNNGGRIFSRVKTLKDLPVSDRDKLWTLPHSANFKSWANMWKLGYKKVSHFAQVRRFKKTSTKRPLVLELQPVLADTEKFWKKYEELFL